MSKLKKSQPADFREDRVDEEVQYRLALANERRKLGEPVVPEEPIRDEPPTLVHHALILKKEKLLILSE